MNNNNGKITLAKVEQKLEDHCEQQEKDFTIIKSDIRAIKDDLSDIKQILVKGDGKIKRNFLILDGHIKNHKWWVTTIIASFAIVVTLCGIVFANIR